MQKKYGPDRRSRQKSGFQHFLWVLTAFVIGYFTAALYDLEHLNAWIKTQMSPKNQSTSQASLAPEKKELPKPKFEFYTLLTKVNDPSPSSSKNLGNTTKPNASLQNHAGKNAPDKHLAEPAKPLSNQPHLQTVKKELYQIQIASFKNQQEAERLKASLILKGLEASIVEAPIQQGGWFRVMVGPYSTKTDAEKIQIKIAQTEHIRGIIHRTKV